MSVIPTQLVADRYRLLEPLGQGGMGRVWKARDEVLHRDVAIKELVPPPGLTEDERREMRERSLREARAIARLNHINVVRVFDVLRTDADPWIVMEYVPSRSLQDVLAADGPLPPVEVAEIGLGVLAALQAAHRAGVVHRDVKPGNVLLGFPPVGTDGKPRVVLTDFGLATVPGDPSVTRTGLVLGSPAYIAPERARDGSIAPAGDLWSLGATLYAAVEGKSPYARSSAMATLAALATEPVPPPKNAGPLKPVLMGLLRKDPAARLTAGEVERLLRRAAGRKARAPRYLGLRRSVLSGSPGRQEPPTKVVPTPRPPQGPQPAAQAPRPGPTTQPDPIPGPGRTVPPAATPKPDVPAPAATVPSRKWRPPRFADRRWGWAVGGLVGLVLLALVVIVPLTGDDPAGERHGASGEGPTPTADLSPSAVATSPADTAPISPTPPSTAPSPTPTAQAPGQQLPAGWRLHRDPSGFAVPVPEGWRVSREKYGSAPDEVRVYFTDPRGGRMLLIDQTNSPRPDPVADWRRQEAARRGGYPGYRRVRIEAVDYWDKAADWEWTYNLNGVRVHVRNRGFITAPDKAYGMYWRTPEAVWAENLELFEVIARGFQPARTG